MKCEVPTYFSSTNIHNHSKYSVKKESDCLHTQYIYAIHLYTHPLQQMRE